MRRLRPSLRYLLFPRLLGRGAGAGQCGVWRQCNAARDSHDRVSCTTSSECHCLENGQQLEGDFTMLKPVLVVLATATLASTGLPSASTSQPLQLLTVTGEVAPIACASPDELYALLNAADRHDLREAARVAGGHCEPLDGAHYEVDRTLE